MKVRHARILSLSAALLSMLSGAVPALAADPIRSMSVDSIEFRADANIPGIASAVIAGSPKQGPNYTVVVKFSPGTRVPAHFHPDTRVITVLAGTYYLGGGEKFDEAGLKSYGPGMVIIIPARSPHYSGAKDDGTVVLESGDAATGTTPTENK
jgi:quercetin dioxygenase-like cupin family protein